MSARPAAPGQATRSSILAPTASLSTVGLAGLRLGWLVGPPGLVSRCWGVRGYTSLSPPRLSQDLALLVQRTWIEGRREDAAELIPDELVLQTNLLGTDQMVTQRIRAYRDAGITTIRVDPEGHGLRERLDTLGRFMRLLDQVNAEA